LSRGLRCDAATQSSAVQAAVPRLISGAQEEMMKAILFALAIAATAIATGAPAQAQNYPWCVFWNGTGGSRNCGFVTYPQCIATAQGAGAFCFHNPAYEPNKPMR
jgi:hypothetical protein